MTNIEKEMLEGLVISLLFNEELTPIQKANIKNIVSDNFLHSIK